MPVNDHINTIDLGWTRVALVQKFHYFCSLDSFKQLRLASHSCASCMLPYSTIWLHSSPTWPTWSIPYTKWFLCAVVAFKPRLLRSYCTIRRLSICACNPRVEYGQNTLQSKLYHEMCWNISVAPNALQLDCASLWAMTIIYLVPQFW